MDPLMNWSFDTQGPIGADVDIAAGSAHFIAGDGNEVMVTVNPANPASKLDVEAAEKARVDFTGSRLSVVVPKPGGLVAYISFRDWGLVNVIVELPTGSSVDAKTGFGELRADGEFGVVSAKSAAGDIHADRVQGGQLISAAGRLTLAASRGDIQLVTAGDMEIGRIDGSAQVKNLNGRTRVGEVSGSIKVKSSNGDIVIDRAHADVHGRTANGSIVIGELVRGAVSLATASGAIDIGIAEGTSAFVDVGTQYGRVRNGLEPTAGPGTGEQVEIRARTAFGDIDINRSSPAENR
jgi:DUF4097 and DUF4098 domain-containing protein YvlB